MNVNDYEDIPDISDEVRHYQNYLKKFSGGFGNQADAEAYTKWSNDHAVRDMMYGFASSTLGPLRYVYDGVEGLAEGLARSRAETGVPNYARGVTQGVSNMIVPGLMKGAGKFLTSPYTRPGLFRTVRHFPAPIPVSTKIGEKTGNAVGNGLAQLLEF